MNAKLFRFEIFQYIVPDANAFASVFDVDVVSLWRMNEEKNPVWASPFYNKTA